MRLEKGERGGGACERAAPARAEGTGEWVLEVYIQMYVTASRSGGREDQREAVRPWEAGPEGVT